MFRKSFELKKKKNNYEKVPNAGWKSGRKWKEWQTDQEYREEGNKDKKWNTVNKWLRNIEDNKFKNVS